MEPYERFRYIARHVLSTAINEACSYVDDERIFEDLDGEDAFAKAIVENDTEKILGFHIVGPQAGDLLHEVVVAMNGTDGTVSSITDSIHVHPTLSERVHTLFSPV